MSTYSGATVIVGGSSPQSEKFVWYEDAPSTLFTSASTAIPVRDGREIQTGTLEEYTDWCDSQGIIVYPFVSPGGAA